MVTLWITFLIGFFTFPILYAIIPGFLGVSGQRRKFFNNHILTDKINETLKKELKDSLVENDKLAWLNVLMQRLYIDATKNCFLELKLKSIILNGFASSMGNTLLKNINVRSVSFGLECPYIKNIKLISEAELDQITSSLNQSNTVNITNKSNLEDNKTAEITKEIDKLVSNKSSGTVSTKKSLYRNENISVLDASNLNLTGSKGTSYKQQKFYKRENYNGSLNIIVDTNNGEDIIIDKIRNVPDEEDPALQLTESTEDENSLNYDKNISLSNYYRKSPTIKQISEVDNNLKANNTSQNRNEKAENQKNFKINNSHSESFFADLFRNTTFFGKVCFDGTIRIIVDVELPRGIMITATVIFKKLSSDFIVRLPSYTCATRYDLTLINEDKFDFEVESGVTTDSKTLYFQNSISNFIKKSITNLIRKSCFYPSWMQLVHPFTASIRYKDFNPIVITKSNMNDAMENFDCILTYLSADFKNLKMKNGISRKRSHSLLNNQHYINGWSFDISALKGILYTNQNFSNFEGLSTTKSKILYLLQSPEVFRLIFSSFDDFEVVAESKSVFLIKVLLKEYSMNYVKVIYKKFVVFYKNTEKFSEFIAFSIIDNNLNIYCFSNHCSDIYLNDRRVLKIKKILEEGIETFKSTVDKVEDSLEEEKCTIELLFKESLDTESSSFKKKWYFFNCSKPILDSVLLNDDLRMKMFKERSIISNVIFETGKIKTIVLESSPPKSTEVQTSKILSFNDKNFLIDAEPEKKLVFMYRVRKVNQKPRNKQSKDTINLHQQTMSPNLEDNEIDNQINTEPLDKKIKTAIENLNIDAIQSETVIDSNTCSVEGLTGALGNKILKEAEYCNQDNYDTGNYTRSDKSSSIIDTDITSNFTNFKANSESGLDQEEVKYSVSKLDTSANRKIGSDIIKEIYNLDEKEKGISETSNRKIIFKDFNDEKVLESRPKNIESREVSQGIDKFEVDLFSPNKTQDLDQIRPCTCPSTPISLQNSTVEKKTKNDADSAYPVITESYDCLIDIDESSENKDNEDEVIAKECSETGKVKVCLEVYFKSDSGNAISNLFIESLRIRLAFQMYIKEVDTMEYLKSNNFIKLEHPTERGSLYFEFRTELEDDFTLTVFSCKKQKKMFSLRKIISKVPFKLIIPVENDYVRISLISKNRKNKLIDYKIKDFHNHRSSLIDGRIGLKKGESFKTKITGAISSVLFWEKKFNKPLTSYIKDEMGKTAIDECGILRTENKDYTIVHKSSLSDQRDIDIYQGLVELI